MNFQNVEFLISAAAPKDFPGNRLPEIAFAGKSNVGKSSVINRLLQRKSMAKVGGPAWLWLCQGFPGGKGPVEQAHGGLLCRRPYYSGRADC